MRAIAYSMAHMQADRVWVSPHQQSRLVVRVCAALLPDTGRCPVHRKYRGKLALACLRGLGGFVLEHEVNHAVEPFATPQAIAFAASVLAHGHGAQRDRLDVELLQRLYHPDHVIVIHLEELPGVTQPLQRGQLLLVLLLQLRGDSFRLPSLRLCLTARSCEPLPLAAHFRILVAQPVCEVDL